MTDSPPRCSASLIDNKNLSILLKAEPAASRVHAGSRETNEKNLTMKKLGSHLMLGLHVAHAQVPVFLAIMIRVERTMNDELYVSPSLVIQTVRR